MIPWATVEDAFHAWVSSASGIETIWSQQNAARPDKPYVAIQVMSIRRIGQDWQDVEDAAVPVPDATIDLKARGVRECLLQMQAFADSATGATMPLAVLESVVASAAHESNRVALNAAGIGIAAFTPIKAIDGVIGSANFEPRAVVESRFFLASEVAETGTHIDTVELTNIGTGNVFTVP